MHVDIRCPKCGSETVVRTAEKGPNAGRKFHLCIRYPECKGKLAIQKQADSIPKKIEEVHEQIYGEMQESLLKTERVFEGLDERDGALLIAADIGVITAPARLSTRLKAYRRLIDELHDRLAQEGISAIDEVLEAERTLLKQTWWGEFVNDWKGKWSIHSESDVGFWGNRYKKLKPYVYEFGYYYQTPADYKDNGPLKHPVKWGHIGPRRIISWRIDIQSNSVAPLILPVSDQLEKGLVLASRGRNEEAVIEFSKYIEMKPNDPMAYVIRGDSYVDIGQFEKAIDEYSKAIQLEPLLAEAYEKRATAYAQLDDYEKALENYNKAIEIHPEGALYYFNMSLVYDKLGNIDESINSLHKSIELDETNAKAYYMRGITYIEKGEYDKAIFDFNRTINIEPSLITDAFFNRGIAYQGKGDHRKALADYKRVLKLVSDPEGKEEVKKKISEVKKLAP